MKPRTVRILYWIATLFVALLVLMDGIGGVTRQQAGVEVMKHLGYPIYFLSINGIAKLLAVVALLQNRFKTIKEWAYAGLVFTFLGAMLSRAYAGDSTFEIIFPIISMGIVLIPYFLWKKMEQLQENYELNESPAK